MNNTDFRTPRPSRSLSFQGGIDEYGSEVQAPTYRGHMEGTESFNGPMYIPDIHSGQGSQQSGQWYPILPSTIPEQIYTQSLGDDVPIDFGQLSQLLASPNASHGYPPSQHQSVSSDGQGYGSSYYHHPLSEDTSASSSLQPQPNYNDNEMFDYRYLFAPSSGTGTPPEFGNFDTHFHNYEDQYHPTHLQSDTAGYQSSSQQEPQYLHGQYDQSYGADVVQGTPHPLFSNTEQDLRPLPRQAPPLYPLDSRLFVPILSIDVSDPNRKCFTDLNIYEARDVSAEVQRRTGYPYHTIRSHLTKNLTVRQAQELKSTFEPRILAALEELYPVASRETTWLYGLSPDEVQEVIEKVRRYRPRAKRMEEQSVFDFLYKSHLTLSGARSILRNDDDYCRIHVGTKFKFQRPGN
jgi:hypothetical protein